MLALYCLNTKCEVAIRAGVPLLEVGYDAKELFAGMRAWKTPHFPIEPEDAKTLARQTARI